MGGTRKGSARAPVQVAVIPAAGRGTRLRPATRAVPKAFVTVVDRPTVQHVAEEAARAGATEIYVIVDPDAVRLVEQHFDEADPLPGLEHATIRPIVQPSPKGLGAAVATAREAVAGRPFFCLLADNISRPGTNPLAELAEAADLGSVLALRHLDDDEVASYGVVAVGKDLRGGIFEVTGAVEKPRLEEAPSRLGILGRYLLSPEIFDVLDGLDAGYGGEIQLTDAIDRLAAVSRCVGIPIEDELFDVGNPVGLAHASTLLTSHPEWGATFRDLINEFAAGAAPRWAV